MAVVNREIVWTLSLLIVLIVSAAAGAFLRVRLPAPHRSNESLDFLRIVTALLATFVALVLSLLLASELASYNTASHDRNHYAAKLTQLDGCMRDFGHELAEQRQQLHGYTAAVIASTWPDEPHPTGVNYPDTSQFPLVGEVPVLTGVMNEIGIALAALQPQDSLHKALATRCKDIFAAVSAARWTVIEDTQGALSEPFVGVLVFWLTMMFLSFGLQAPRNSLSFCIIAIAIASVISVVFVILDLDLPYGGIFGISSHSMRLTLADMLR
ncbi:DUF4239 domain-containing protein [Brucella intermedia]|uniref:DUF4239 domain-containing protein n=5 Tax=Brucella intermedia TaxID=94625 RepID=U4VG83_9HYPH|nr:MULTISPECIES: DUF4239 domain-containing protein [Brucella/Ochrobactrum group]ERM01852.1 hypothetical protein Q644_19495 [Brucella intermedia 229E]KAB2670043.1 DUF4239 domain-containing protein [Ochrobactrum sp. LMG 5442]EEQ94546.1 Hypothetical protein OINT_2001780 [Brucella intermedia LMG 3301]ELT49210.1 hypothetical protein D584_10557 [Brucella intermedia M86]KAB2707442.1 DUF4239 domain-containing protein [Brucella intermedia]